MFSIHNVSIFENNIENASDLHLLHFIISGLFYLWAVVSL